MPTQVRVMNMYGYWQPEATAVNFQHPPHELTTITDHLQIRANTMGIAEMSASPTHRYFVMPLDMQLLYPYGLIHRWDKNYFAAFVMPWDSEEAIFQGVGVINGPSKKKLAKKLNLGVDLFLPAEYGIRLII